MIQNCKFDLSRDIGQTLQGLAPDINRMLETHVVPSGTEEVVYNQLTELEQIGVRINDDFDLLMIARGLKQLGDNASLNPNGGTGSSQGPAPVASAEVTNVSE